MKFLCSGVRGDFRDIGGVQTGARHDDNAVGCSGDELAERGGAFGSTGSTAGSQYARGAGFDDVLESAKRVRNVVERAVERDLQWTRCINQLARAFDIDGAVFAEDTERDAIQGQVADGGNRTKHRSEFAVRVHEIAAKTGISTSS